MIFSIIIIVPDCHPPCVETWTLTVRPEIQFICWHPNSSYLCHRELLPLIYTQWETPVIWEAPSKHLRRAISPAWDWRRFMTLLAQARLFYPGYDWAEMGPYGTQRQVLCCRKLGMWGKLSLYKQGKRKIQTSTNKEYYCPYLYSAHLWRTKLGLRPHCKRQTPRAVGNSHQLHPGPGL